MYTNANISIFNKTIDKTTKQIFYKKHFIENAFWDSIDEVSSEKGYDKDNKVDIFIPKDKNDMKLYITPKKYDGAGWTISEGDFVVKGKTTESKIDKFADIYNKYDEVYIITSVSNKDFGSNNMRHFEIKGK